jgi:serine/threonine protein kinase
VAMKMLSHELVYEQDFAQRFMDEARTIAELHHDNIVQVYDAEQAYATFFIIMERLDGEELKKRIDRGPLSFAETRRILRQVAAGLAYAHRHGVVHRDIKPTNIFLESTGRAKIMDFGIAGAPLSAAEAQVAGIVGTPGYIAPELMLGLGADERADIYALGVMTYEMLVGQSPFAAKTRQEVLANQLRTSEVLVRAERPDTPDDLAEWIRRATCRERDQRIASCDELFALLGEDEHLADSPTSTAFRLAGQCATEERALVEQILARCRAELAALASVHLDPS